MIRAQNKQYFPPIAPIAFLQVHFANNRPEIAFVDTINLLRFDDEIRFLPVLVRVLFHVFSRYNKHREFVGRRTERVCPPFTYLFAQARK